jgi:CBS domain-containing protein
MDQAECSFLPVVQGGAIVGVVTARDIVLRVVAQGLSPLVARVGEIMTLRPACIDADRDIEDAAQLMKQELVIHLVVVDHLKRAIGVISLVDLAGVAADASLCSTVRRISERTRTRYGVDDFDFPLPGLYMG